MLEVSNRVSRCVFKVAEVLWHYEGFGLRFIHLLHSVHDIFNGKEVKGDNLDEYAEEHLAVCWHQYIDQREVSDYLHHMDQAPQVIERTRDKDIQEEVGNERCLRAYISILDELSVNFIQASTIKLWLEALARCQSDRNETERSRRLEERVVYDDEAKLISDA